MHGTDSHACTCAHIWRDHCACTVVQRMLRTGIRSIYAIPRIRSIYPTRHMSTTATATATATATSAATSTSTATLTPVEHKTPASFTLHNTSHNNSGARCGTWKGEGEDHTIGCTIGMGCARRVRTRAYISTAACMDAQVSPLHSPSSTHAPARPVSHVITSPSYRMCVHS